jgi:Arc/MetJ-type ribon-helix-helix transcriptional regulator
MGTQKMSVTLDRGVVRMVDRLVTRGRFTDRDQAIRAAVNGTLGRRIAPLSATAVLRLARKAREDHRKGKTKEIKSLADL